MPSHAYLFFAEFVGGRGAGGFGEGGEVRTVIWVGLGRWVGGGKGGGCFGCCVSSLKKYCVVRDFGPQTMGFPVCA